MNSRLTFSRVGRTAVGLTLLGALAVTANPATAADHKDGTTTGTPANKADPTADINDVYAFMDGSSVVLGMTVVPFAADTAKFSTTVRYVFHVRKHTAFNTGTGTETRIVCQFAGTTTQTISCWFGGTSGAAATDYVTGDADIAAGITSPDGWQVFAGRRADPFYFYLTGFNAARATALSAITGGLTFSASGCAQLSAGQGAALVDDLTTTVQTDNDFRDLSSSAATGANTLAIVIKAPKALVSDTTNPVLSVYASTHAP